MFCERGNEIKLFDRIRRQRCKKENNSLTGKKSTIIEENLESKSSYCHVHPILLVPSLTIFCIPAVVMFGL